MAKKKRDKLFKQKVAVGVGIAVIAAVLIALSFVVVKDTPLGGFVEGEHYQILENPRRIRGDKVEIMEFFSYACPHCYTFDPELNDWVASHADRIHFVRTPAVGNERWRVLARNYYAMQQLGLVEQDHHAVFQAIHEANLDLSTESKLAQFLDGKGTTVEAYEAAYESPAVDSKMRLAEQLAKRMKIATVPTVIVDGKYKVQITSTVGPSRMLDVMDHLLDMEQEADTP